MLNFWLPEQVRFLRHFKNYVPKAIIFNVAKSRQWVNGFENSAEFSAYSLLRDFVEESFFDFWL